VKRACQRRGLLLPVTKWQSKQRSEASPVKGSGANVPTPNKPRQIEFRFRGLFIVSIIIVTVYFRITNVTTTSSTVNETSCVAIVFSSAATPSARKQQCADHRSLIVTLTARTPQLSANFYGSGFFCLFKHGLGGYCLINQ